jgi:hypothetical protein
MSIQVRKKDNTRFMEKRLAFETGEVRTARSVGVFHGKRIDLLGSENGRLWQKVQPTDRKQRAARGYDLVHHPRSDRDSASIFDRCSWMRSHIFLPSAPTSSRLQDLRYSLAQEQNRESGTAHGDHQAACHPHHE